MTPLVEFAVVAGAGVTSTAAIQAARYARSANDKAGTALDVLEGPTGDGGLVETVDENRRALLHGDLYPPRATDGGGNNPESTENQQ